MKKIIFGLAFVTVVVSAMLFGNVSASHVLFSNVRAESIVGPGAQIKWTTNIASDSRVLGGTSSDSASWNVFSDSRCDAGGNVTDHCVSLTSLSYSTVYYYKVESGDSYASGYSFTSGTSTGGGGGTSSTGSVPAVPGNLAASVSNSQITLTWTDLSTNENEFQIYHRLSGGNWSYLNVVGQNATYYIIPNLAVGTYEYHINACNSYGCSSDSNMASATVSTTASPSPSPTYSPTPTPNPEYPTAPTSVTASIYSTSRVDVGWSGATDNIGVTNYNIWRNNAFLANANAPTSTYSDVYVSFGQTYSYYVIAYDAQGNQSPLSMTATVTIPSTSPTPTPMADAVVSGIVFDSQGKAVAGAWYHVFKSDYSLNFDGSTDSAGTFRVNVPAGSYVAEVFPPSTATGDLLRPEPQTFSISSGETKSLTFKFESGSKIIAGTVMFSNGQPVTNAGIGAYSKDTGQWAGTMVDSNGKYSFAVSGGKWEVGVWPKEGGTVNWSFPGPYQIIEFKQDASAETKTANFTIPTSDAKLVVKTVDDKGTALASVGVVVDVQSAGQYVPGSTTQSLFLKTDASGLASFNLKAGTYYVRAYFPDNFGYINPSEQSVSINSGETKNITMTFKKPETTTTVIIKGITKLDDGRAIDAFVWAWSEKGGFKDTRSGTNGEFNFQVAPNDKWHIGAGREFDGFPYKSSDIVIAVGGIDVSVEIILSKFSEIPLAKIVTTTSLVTEQIITQTTDGAKVSIPPNSVSTSGSINVEIKPTVEAPSQASAEVIGTVYDVTVTGSGGQAITQFNQDVEITLPYNESDLSAQGISESNIAPSYYDETTGTWVKTDNYVVDKDKNIVIIKVQHLTRYAIVAAADITPPADVTGMSGVALGGGKVKLTWTNPTKDFSHAKVYRSETAGSLGKIAANEVTGSEYTDESGLINGTTYYYTVRSVDPAGNENSTTKQTTVKAIGTSVVQTATLIYGLNDGDVVSAAGSDDPDVYIVNLHGFKRLFLNPAIFKFYGHLGGFAKVKAITPATRDKFGTSGIFRNCETNDSKVYGVEVTGEDTAVLRWVNTSGEQAVADDANFFKKVFCINTREFNWYKKGSNYSSVTQIPAYLRK